jgi:hypothetical protein
MISLSSINFIDTVTSVKQLVAVTNGVFKVNGASITGDVTTGNLTSTVIGLGTSGYLSTVVFNGVVSTANIAGFVSTANLTGLVSTANLANLISTANLAGLVSTANLSGLVSTGNLIGLVSTANLANLVSTANLANLVSTANLVDLVSTNNLIDLVSTANLRDLVSTPYFDSQITSSLIGLGNLGYLSSFQAREFSTSLVQVSSIRFMDSTTTAPDAGTISLLHVSSGQLLFNGGYTGSGGGGGVTQLVAGTGITLNPPVGTGAVTLTVNISSILDPPLTSTLNDLERLDISPRHNYRVQSLH